MEPGAFELSRIYGKGWNAAKQWLAEHDRDPTPNQAGRLNPYDALAERARWGKGFEEGLLSPTGGRGMASLRSRRPDGGA